MKHMMQAMPAEGIPDRATGSPPQSKQDPLSVSFLFQGKCKKRRLSEQMIVPCKRMKLEESDLRRGCVVNFGDFAIIARKQEGIKSVSFMDQLFYVMLEDHNNHVSKLVDAVSHRTMLASIIAATEKEECLTRFVRLGGLRILNDWLQEAHEGKTGDDSPKNMQTVFEGLLLMLIRALAKLPVDFDALKNCIVGKSVNKLRTHPNLEIRKMARELVDTWKKRVNAEMKSSDEVKTETSVALPSRAATESWSTKTRSTKGITHIKPVTNGVIGTGDTKSTDHPEGGCKDNLAVSHFKQSPKKPIVGVSKGQFAVVKQEKDIIFSEKGEKDMLSVVKKEKDILPDVKEEKSLSSSQSQNNTQASSSGFTKSDGLWKDEKKLTVPLGHKVGTKNHGHTKGPLKVPAVSLQKYLIEKQQCEKIWENRASERARSELNNPRLIVRLPNPGRNSSHAICKVPHIEGSAVPRRASLSGSLRQDSRKVEDDRQCLEADEEKDWKPMVLEHKSTDCGVNSAQTTVQRNMPGSSERSPPASAFDPAHGGIDLLATVAACEANKTEESFGRNDDAEGHPVPNKFLINSSVHNSISPVDHQDDMMEEQRTCDKVSLFKPENEVSTSSFARTPCRPVEDAGCREEALTCQEQPCLSCASQEKTPATLPVIEAMVCEEEELVHRDSIAREEEETMLVNSSPIGSWSTGQPPPAPESNSVSASEGCQGHERAPNNCVPLATEDANDFESLRSSGKDVQEAAKLVAAERGQEIEKNFKSEVQDGESVNPNTESSVCEDIPTGSNKMASGNFIEAAQTSTKAGMCSLIVDERGMRDNEESRLEVGTANAAVPVVLDVSVSVITEKKESADKENPCLDKMQRSDGFFEKKDVVRPIFDLNKGFDAEVFESIASHPITASPTPGLPCLDLSSGPAVQKSSLPAPIAVLAATKRAFIPPATNPTWAKQDLRWKGSAATSAFRPAEPRRVAETSLPSCGATASPCASPVAPAESRKQSRILNIDLNVADERVPDDCCTIERLSDFGRSERPVEQKLAASRPELDLNRVDENDEWNHSIRNSRCASTSRTRLSVTPLAASAVMLDIDLNSGLGNGEEKSSEHGIERLQIPATGGARHNVDIANVCSWNFTARSTPAAMMMPVVPTAMVMPALPTSRFESSYPVVNPPVLKTGSNIFGPFINDLHQGMAVAPYGVPYYGSTPSPFPFSGFPFGSNLSFSSASHNMASPLSSASASFSPLLTTAPSQLVSTGSVVSSYVRPHVIGSVREIPGLESNAPWIRASLDLNAGPEISAEIDNRESAIHGIGLGQPRYKQTTSLGGRREPDCSFDPFRAAGCEQTTWW